MATVQCLLERRLLERSRWAASTPGSCLHVDVEDCAHRTVLYNSILNKNMEAAAILVRAGAKLTDEAYVLLYGDRKSRRELTRLLPVVVHVATEMKARDSLDFWVPTHRYQNAPPFSRQFNESHDLVIRSAEIWASPIDWSFPPLWRKGMTAVALCIKAAGLPAFVVNCLVQMCSRAWFFANPRDKSNWGAPRLARIRPNFDNDGSSLPWT